MPHHNQLLLIFSSLLPSLSPVSHAHPPRHRLLASPTAASHHPVALPAPLASISPPSSQELSNLITNDAISQDVRASAVHRLVPCLSSQLKDKRSTLVKEVCLLISRSAESLGYLFEPCAPKLIRMLLQLTYVTVKVISQSGQDCISALVSSVSCLHSLHTSIPPRLHSPIPSLPLHLHLKTPLDL